MSTTSMTRAQRQRVGTRPTAVKIDRKVWLYVIPVCAVFAIVFVAPLIYTIYISLHETTYYQIGQFSGMESFTQLFADKSFPGEVLTTLVFSVGALVVALPLGFVSAIVLNNITRLRRLVRALFLLPWLMSQATAGTIWFWFLNPNYGPATAFTKSLGLGTTNVFSSPIPALIAVTLITAWWSYPQAMLLFLGALQTVPVELKESVRVDGGNAWQAFRNVTLPYIRNSIVSVVIVLLMLYVQMVTIIVVTTRGGPLDATETLAVRVYNQTFTDYNLTGASATALVLFVLNIILTLIVIRLRRRDAL